MTDPDAIQKALLDWAVTRDPEGKCVLLMNTPEIVTLHYMLALCQWLLERSGSPVDGVTDLGALRKKVEAILVGAGYGGDPRP